MKLMNLPKTHPMSFRRLGGSRYGGMIDRNFMLGKDPMTRYQHKPLANLLNCEDFYLLELPLAGYKMEDLEIVVEFSKLTVKGSHSSEEKSITDYVLKEYDVESFERCFELNALVNQDNISAKFENGILKIKLPHFEEKPKTKKQEIKVL